MTTILLASRNAKKLTELRRVVAAAGITGLDVVGLDDVPEFAELPEDGATFEDNALIKARTGAAATGLPTLADDSGISVDALNGMPGVLSARWSGTHGDDAANNTLLLAQLSDVPDDRRGAAFVSACALVRPDGTETVVRGEWRGTLAREPRRRPIIGRTERRRKRLPQPPRQGLVRPRPRTPRPRRRLAPRSGQGN